MTQDQRTVRQWLSLYRAGAFESKDLDDQRTAGWRRFSCRFDALPGRLRQMAPMIAHIQEPFILDQYTVWFENAEYLSRKLLYDRMRFQPLDDVLDGLAFYVDFKNPDEIEKWVLYAERTGFAAPEYGCTGALEMSRYINTLAQELKQDIRPLFMRELSAVIRYAMNCGAVYSSVCRVGYHRYSFLDQNGQKKTVQVTCRLKDLPPDLRMFKSTDSSGLYVYCLQEQAKPCPIKDGEHSHKKRKDFER